MNTYLVLYLAPAANLEVWMKMPEAERKSEEAKMMADWNTWMAAHGAAFKTTAGTGKTKRVTKDGIVDVKNDVMLYSVIEAESDEAAAALFTDHPHFGIPGATIEVMPAKNIPAVVG